VRTRVRASVVAGGQILPAFVFTSVDALMKTLVSDDATSIIGRVYTVRSHATTLMPPRPRSHGATAHSEVLTGYSTRGSGYYGGAQANSGAFFVLFIIQSSLASTGYSLLYCVVSPHPYAPRPPVYSAAHILTAAPSPPRRQSAEHAHP
jgi:hypothetical protein